MDKNLNYEEVFTEEKLKQPVTFRDLCMLMEETEFRRAEAVDKLIRTYADGIYDVIKILSDQLCDIKYEQMRDRRFLMRILSSLHHLDYDALYEEYIRWCEEYDKLNRPSEE